MDKVQTAKRNIFWGLLNKFTLVIAPFMMRTAVVYSIGSNYLGLDSLYTSILQMLNIAELGFSSALVFSMYKPLADNDIEEVCALLNLYKKVYRIVGLVVLCLGMIVIPFLPSLIKSDTPKDINIYYLYMFFLINTVLGYWLYAYKKSLLSACRREDVVSKITSLITIIKTILQFFVLFILRNYYAFVGVMIVATVIENILANYCSNHLFIEFCPKGKTGSERIKDIIQRIKGLFIQRICATSRNSMDSIIISTYLGLNIVAMYGNYYYILFAIHGIMGTIINSILAIVGNSVAKDSPSKNYKDMLTFNFMYMWIASFCTVCMMCMYQPFITLWMGKGMLLPEKTMILLCVYFYSLCMGDVRSMYYNAAGLWWEGRYRSIVEAASNIVLNIVLGKFFGLNGVVIATLISIVVINFGYGSTIIHKYYFKGISSITFYKKHISYAFSTIVAALICYKLCMLFSLEGIPSLITNFLTCFFVSNCLFFTVYFRKEECKNSIAIVRRLIVK